MRADFARHSGTGIFDEDFGKAFIVPKGHDSNHPLVVRALLDRVNRIVEQVLEHQLQFGRVAPHVGTALDAQADRLFVEVMPASRIFDAAAQQGGEVDAPPAAPAGGLSMAREVLDRPERERLQRKIAQANAALERIDRQIETAERALPLYKATQQVDGLIADLRTRRVHPVHTLLRRMYRESQQP